jgi:glycerophosphoryl diester phosphodiesterase
MLLYVNSFIIRILKLGFILSFQICIIFSLFFPFNAKIKKMRDPHDVFFHRTTFIEAHRGMNREIFQNTIESFKKAIQYKIDCLETDVWLTKDNVLVLVHGYGQEGNIRDFFGIPGSIKKYTYDEISSFRTINDSLKMPTLREAMNLTKDKIFLDLEIKDSRVDRVFPYLIELIEEYDFFNQISLTSFYHDYYYKIMEYNKSFNKSLVFGFLYEKNESNYDFTKNGSIISIYQGNITREMCEIAHSNGMAILAWFSYMDEDREKEYKNLFDYKVDAICCNKPKIAQKIRDHYFRNK